MNPKLNDDTSHDDGGWGARTMQGNPRPATGAAYGGKNLKVLRMAILHLVLRGRASLTGRVFEYDPGEGQAYRALTKEVLQLESSGRKPSLTSYDDIFSTVFTPGARFSALR